MNKMINSILLALVLLVPGSILTQTQTAEATTDFNFKVFATGLNGMTHELPLKATQEDGKVDTVSNFEIEPENVVQVRDGQFLHIFLDSDEEIEKVKTTD